MLVITVITLHQKASKGYSEISPFWWNLHRSFGGSCRQPLHVGGQHIPRTTQRAISPYLKVHRVAILRYPPNKNTTELGIDPKWCPLDVSCFMFTLTVVVSSHTQRFIWQTVAPTCVAKHEATLCQLPSSSLGITVTSLWHQGLRDRKIMATTRRPQMLLLSNCAIDDIAG